MAEGAGIIYDRFKQGVMQGDYDLTGANIKVMMTYAAYTPNAATHDDKTDVTNEVTGSGYVAGGEALDTPVVTKETGHGKFDDDGTNTTWASLLIDTTPTPSWAVMYDDDSTGDLLIAYWELGTTATNGGDYTLQWSASGIVTIT